MLALRFFGRIKLNFSRAVFMQLMKCGCDDCTVRYRHMRGFTLIELMVTVVVIAILAAIALPSYAGYIKKSRAKNASADLVALSLNLENQYQLHLVYPVNADGTVATTALFSGWAPTQSDYFSYAVGSTTTTYTLTASGSGSLSGCNLTLDQKNQRTVTSACGFTSW
jgi:type IV pilus assembly protein PilE